MFTTSQLSRRNLLAVAAGLVSSAPAMLRVAGTSPANASAKLPVLGNMPSLEGAVAWLNSPALSKDNLRGKVVLVNFWTYTCINSLRPLAYVRTWAEKYRSQGLVIIGAHTPEFAFERQIENVRRATTDLKIEHPVAIDSNYAVWQAFENQYWPAFYLIDSQGRIRHRQFGEGEYDSAEHAIQRLLQEAGAQNIDTRFNPVDGHGIELAGNWQTLQSPETYLGYAHTQNFVRQHDHGLYASPSHLKLNHWSLDGDWNVNDNNASVKRTPGRIGYCFHARDLHLVMTSAQHNDPIRFRVSLDGQPPGKAHGLDVDEQGNGILREPRLYQLIRQQATIEDRRFDIEFLDPGAAAYVFTFG
jgi:thiol-disulfide isomerase/thioredoxin